MRRLGESRRGTGDLASSGGATMSFAGWRMGGESWLEIEAAGHIGLHDAIRYPQLE
ncbi:MAG: hypothetical protein ACLSAF_17425 [Intestinimonas sp.]